MQPIALNAFSFYFNYDYGRPSSSMSCVDNEEYVKHIVDTFYKYDLGKIVKVRDMISDNGRFFIITFNKETFNWSNPEATSIYTTGFPSDTWCKHITNKDETVSFRSPDGNIWEIYLTSFPDIDENPELLGEWCYDIIWTINEYDEEYETFEIKMYKNNTNDSILSNSVYCVDNDGNLSCKCGGCPDIESNDSVTNEIVQTESQVDGRIHWGGDNTWDNYDDDDDTQISLARENDINEWMTKEQKEQQFYENWALELDELSMKYCGNSWGEKCIWEPTVYKYDLTDISYTSSLHDLKYIEKTSNGYTPGNGYTAYSKKEFIEYYGKEDGEMRWNSNIYSAMCKTEGDPFVQDPPEGCKLNYNISYIALSLCIVYDNDDDFDINRTIVRKYVDALWSFTDPTDDDNEQKPVIKLRADYNSNTFNVSCWYRFKYTNLQGDKLRNIELLVKNFKSWYISLQSDNMIEWIPSAE
jgi:hypothetical protein